MFRFSPFNAFKSIGLLNRRNGVRTINAATFSLSGCSSDADHYTDGLCRNIPASCQVDAAVFLRAVDVPVLRP